MLFDWTTVCFRFNADVKVGNDHLIRGETVRIIVPFHSLYNLVRVVWYTVQFRRYRRLFMFMATITCIVSL